MQKIAKLKLDDLSPASAVFYLSKFPDVEFTLGAFTLRVQIWLTKKFGQAAIENAIAGTDLEVISETAYFVLDAAGRARFSTLDKFQDAIVSYKDREAIKNALLETMGLSQPVLEGLERQLEEQRVTEGNALAPSTGASSTIESPAPTAGVLPTAS